MRIGNYTLSVRVKDRNAQEYLDNKSVTYIEGRRGSEYTLSFTNHTNQKKLVIFSVDGLDTISGKVASPEAQGYIVYPFGTIEIPGWTIDNNRVAKFQFRPQGDRENSTYVEELRSEGFDVDASNQGVIGCMVIGEGLIKQYRSRSVSGGYTNTDWSSIRQLNYFDPLYPAYNLGSTSINNLMAGCASAAPVTQMFNSVYTGASAQAAVAESPSLGTGFGADQDFQTSTVSFERGSVETILTMRYETREKLRKLGLIVDKTLESQAFPGYNGDKCHIPKSRRR
jgi:hypothetical protein